jgi:TetR/AcrR family transcriptional repressor of nem operon
VAGNGTEAGPRLTRRGRETRERIVAAAAELIFERGVAETTLEDIRAAAGVSGSQVYHYFADKQALVRAVIDHQADTILETQGTHLDHLDTMPGLRAWRDLLVGHQRTLECRGGCPLGTLGAELAEIDDVARMAVARGFGRWEARIRDGLRAMHARGDLPASSDPDDLALATLAALQGGLLLAQVQRDPRPLAVALDAMIDRIQALSETASRNAGVALQQLRPPRLPRRYLEVEFDVVGHRRGRNRTQARAQPVRKIVNRTGDATRTCIRLKPHAG